MVEIYWQTLEKPWSQKTSRNQKVGWMRSALHGSAPCIEEWSELDPWPLALSCSQRQPLAISHVFFIQFARSCIQFWHLQSTFSTAGDRRGTQPNLRSVIIPIWAEHVFGPDFSEIAMPAEAARTLWWQSSCRSEPKSNRSTPHKLLYNKTQASRQLSST